MISKSSLNIADDLICLPCKRSSSPAAITMSAPAPKRVCQIIKVCSRAQTTHPSLITIAQLKPGAEAEYTRLHAAVWPGVLAALARAHITDYTIHHAAALGLLVAHFTYTGTDYAGDMRRVGEDAETRRWWALTDGLQESFNAAATGSGGEEEWWTVRWCFLC